MSAFIDANRDRFGVEPACRALGVSVSAYYQRLKGPSPRQLADRALLGEIERIEAGNYHAYGSLRVWKELGRRGQRVARCTVERVMRANGIQGAKRRGRPWRTTIPGEERADLPDLVERDFTADRPDELWVCDFTYLRTWEGVAYFAFVIDVFSRKVVGWQIASHMRTSLVQDALEMALGLRWGGADAWLVHHTDRGSQYTSEDYTQVLDDAGVLASLGSVGDCYDNALAESFVDSFKTELISDRVWRTLAQLELAICPWVGWFNTERLHSSIGHMPPDEFEADYWKKALGEPGAGSDRPTGSLHRPPAPRPPDNLKQANNQST